MVLTFILIVSGNMTCHDSIALCVCVYTRDDRPSEI
uniref:Uncharacterized protein n=1 Tax=viral metagenome TaxID=1070528 RepID=A0A6C0BLR4_9ZZZZ